MSAQDILPRDRALDALRGIAALGILIWHYQHFFELGSFSQPYERALSFFYKFGSVMVEFFFCLSGYIFYLKYSDSIQGNQITFKKFIILRISRLYPLIILTTLVVFVLQYALLLNQGNFFIYQLNDYFSFLTNLLFLQSGFFENGYSFNAPSWSLGVEFWLYVMFFLICKRFEKMAFACLLASLLAFSVYTRGLDVGFIVLTPPFQKGIASFFMGCFLAFCVRGLHLSNRLWRELLGGTFFVLSLLGFWLAHLKFSGKLSGIKTHFFLNESLSITLLANPMLILGAQLSQIINRALSVRVLAFFGDISYSMYLWHVPIQLFIFVLVFMAGIKVDPESKVFWWGYMGVVVLISSISTWCFEQPAQKYLRARLLRAQNTAI